MSNTKNLSEAVAKKYMRPHGMDQYRFIHKGKSVDLRTMTVAQADDLVKNGFPFLVPIEEEKTSAAEKKQK